MIGLGLGKQAIALLSEPPDGGMTQLTGDVTAGPGSGSQAATIAARAVTVAKFQAIATASILGRTTAGSGDVEILTAAQARSVIGAVNIAGDTMTGPLSFSGTTNSGLRLSNLTTTQRDAIVSPAAGMAIWNTTLTRLNLYNGAAWTNGYVKIDGDTMTGPLVNSTNGALSTPAFQLTGAPITGGTATTTKPLVLIETAGATSSAWSTSGTMIGVNAPSGFAGTIVDVQVNGSFRTIIDANGNVKASNSIRASSNLGFISIGSADDVSLYRDAADTLALRRSTNPQTVRVYNSYTDNSNGDYFGAAWAGNVCYVGTWNTGTYTTARQLNLVTGGSSRWSLTSSGHFTAAIDNTYDIGASSAARPRLIHTGSGAVLGSVSIDSLAGITTLRMRSDVDGILLLQNDATTSFDRIQLGGTTSSFPALKRSSATLQARLADDSAFALFECSQIKTHNGTALVSGTALTNGAAAQVGTLTNAPAAGNPTKWIPIDDNGTTRYIPAW